MENIKAWKESSKEMILNIGSIQFMEGEGCIINDEDPDCILLQYTGLKDSGGVEAWEGDLRMLHGKLYKLVNDGWRFRFERNLVEFGENADFAVDEDTIWDSEWVGNVYENSHLLLNKLHAHETH